MVMKERAKPRTFPSGVLVDLARSYVDPFAPRGRTLDGGDNRPPVSMSPGMSPWKKAGRPMGPPPRYVDLKVIILFSLCCSALAFIITNLLRRVFWGKMYGWLSPSGLGLCSPWCGTLLFLSHRFLGSLSCLVLFYERKLRDNMLGGSPSSRGEHCLRLSYPPPDEWVQEAPSWAAVWTPPVSTLWLTLVYRSLYATGAS